MTLEAYINESHMRYLLLLVLPLLTIGCKNQQLELKEQQITQLEKQIETLNSTNAGLLDRMADLSIISKDGAESIKASLENINEQSAYIKDLNRKVQQKDSLNLALVMNLKRSLADIDDGDINVEVKGGKVHVSISDRLLFTSGSALISEAANSVLGKIAAVVNDHSTLDVVVEGHTDNVPMNSSCIKDNWDLSVKRATAVVRALQQDYLVSATRLTAAGRSQYEPKSDNDTPIGRSLNRRTEIIIQPSLDQFFDLLQDNPMLN